MFSVTPFGRPNQAELAVPTRVRNELPLPLKSEYFLKRQYLIHLIHLIPLSSPGALGTVVLKTLSPRLGSVRFGIRPFELLTLLFQTSCLLLRPLHSTTALLIVKLYIYT
jgi:hypothetical protein